jgi:hypothetical protein
MDCDTLKIIYDALRQRDEEMKSTGDRTQSGMPILISLALRAVELGNTSSFAGMAAGNPRHPGGTRTERFQAAVRSNAKPSTKMGGVGARPWRWRAA